MGDVMKENVGPFLCILLFAAFLASTGWSEYKQKTPRIMGGYNRSGKGFLISSAFFLVGAFAILTDVEFLAVGTLAIGMVIYVFSVSLRSYQPRKPHD
jgi:hypothetical protein